MDEVNASNLSPAQQAAAALERDTFQQNVLAQCMKDQGFEYTPYVSDYGAESFTNYRTVEHEAIWTAEQQFIADHQAEFDALKAALAQGS
jgi:hypothetical protein